MMTPELIPEPGDIPGQVTLLILILNLFMRQTEDIQS